MLSVRREHDPLRICNVPVGTAAKEVDDEPARARLIWFRLDQKCDFSGRRLRPAMDDTGSIVEELDAASSSNAVDL